MAPFQADGCSRKLWGAVRIQDAWAHIWADNVLECQADSIRIAIIKCCHVNPFGSPIQENQGVARSGLPAVVIGQAHDLRDIGGHSASKRDFGMWLWLTSARSSLRFALSARGAICPFWHMDAVMVYLFLASVGALYLLLIMGYFPSINLFSPTLIKSGFACLTDHSAGLSLRFRHSYLYLESPRKYSARVMQLRGFVLVSS